MDVQPGQVCQVAVQAQGHQKTGVLHRVLRTRLGRRGYMDVRNYVILSARLRDGNISAFFAAWNDGIPAAKNARHENRELSGTRSGGEMSKPVTKGFPNEKVN